MSMKGLPLLYINLGGEMMYILDQRLRAQNISKDKTKKVLLDIIGSMFNSRLMDEMFKPQELYTKKSMRTMFDHLAHASIMRLNEGSMDKLYDLMTMGFKYQITFCKRPQDLILVTLNHLDILRSYVSGSGQVTEQVENVFRLLRQEYCTMTPGQLMLVRQKLLGFFQDMHVRVSLFLRDQVQDNTGRFILQTGGNVAVGVEVPGKIRFYKSNGDKQKTVEFLSGGFYTVCSKDGSYESVGDRVTKLGTNMYDGTHGTQTEPTVSRVNSSNRTLTSASDLENNIPDPRAKAQLDLLSKLIGGRKQSRDSNTAMPEFKLNLFNSTEDDSLLSTAVAPPVSSTGDSNVVNIDASKKKQSAELSRIMGDLDELNIRGGRGRAHSEEENDLLDLLDSA